jgi:hypothetical protein
MRPGVQLDEQPEGRAVAVVGGAAARLFSHNAFALSAHTAYRLSFKCASGVGQTTGDLTNSVFINYWNYGQGNKDLALLTFTAPREAFASYSYDFTTGADTSGGPRILWDTDSSTPSGNAAALAPQRAESDREKSKAALDHGGCVPDHTPAGTVQVEDNGATWFRPAKDGKGPHRYLVMSPEQTARVREAIVQLCVAPPTK